MLFLHYALKRQIIFGKNSEKSFHVNQDAGKALYIEKLRVPSAWLF